MAPIIEQDLNQGTEIWRPIRGYEGLFEVSDLGRVRRSGVPHGRTRVGRILRGALRLGYVRVNLRSNGRMKTHAVHRLVVESFLRLIDHGEEPNHKNLDRRDNRLSNLEIISHSENLLHANANGHGMKGKRGLRGETNGNSKLTADAVREIRALYKGSRKHPSQREIAERFGVHQTVIGDIVRGEIWRA